MRSRSTIDKRFNKLPLSSKLQHVWQSALCLALLTVLLAAQSGNGVADRVGQDAASLTRAPEELSGAEWQGIREAHERWRRTIAPVAGGWRATNRRQQLQASFDRRGFSVQPDRGDWSWGLELASYGVGAVQQEVGAAVISTTGERIEYKWDEQLAEWLTNDEAGIEHGFTIRQRPAGPTDAPLSLRLRYRGDLRPVGAVSGQNLRLGRRGVAAPPGQDELLNYEKLLVWDARGLPVPAWFEAASDEQLRIVVDDRTARYPVTIDPTISQQAFLKASTNNSSGYGDDRFGHAVAIDGQTVVIGAPGERSNATGVNGNQTDNSANDSGAAYVFVRTGAGWSQQAYLKASNSGEFDQFGISVSISGETIVVGASQEDSAATGVNGNQADNVALEAGAAYVFVRTGTTWSQQAYLKASNAASGDFFGGAVSIYAGTIVVGAELESSAATGVNGNQASNDSFSSGAAYVFVRNGTTWTQQAYLKASNTGDGDLFGSAVAINGETIVVGAYLESSGASGINGNQADNSTFGAGAAYVFVRQGTTWSQQQYLKASNTSSGDFFGQAVAISGETLVVGARNEASAATGINGDGTDNSLPEAGAVYVFLRIGVNWSQQAYLKASRTERSNRFGSAVAITDNTLIIGAEAESGRARGINGDEQDIGALAAGATYIFTRTPTGIWSQEAYVKASNTSEYSRFGNAVAISGETVIVGAVGEPSSSPGVNNDQSDQSARSAGAAYAFVRSGTTWTQQAYLKASNAEEYYGPDNFGHAVAIAGDTVVVGAWGEASPATGVNGNEAGTRAQESGAVYVFVRSGNNWTQQAYLKASNAEADDSFGRAVAISGDTLVVGAPDEDSAASGVNGNQASNGLSDSGAAYVFVREGAVWTQQAYLKASNTSDTDRFGWAVGISGETIVIGAWSEDSQATGINGNQADNSLIDSGAAYVFIRQGTTWSQQAYLKASNTGNSDNFGVAVAISGETIVIGAYGESSNATGINGNQADNSAPDAGAVYVFIRTGGSWSQQAYLKPSNSSDSSVFGFAVAIAGQTIVVGAPLEDNDATGVNGNQAGARSYDSGAAYVFVRSSAGWSQQAYLKASNTGPDEKFGRAVGITGNSIVIGADGEGSNATGINGDQSSDLAPESGAAYLFTRTGTSWSQTGYLKASNTGAFDKFGTAVAISVNTIIVGAEGEDSSVSGINNAGSDNLAEDTGAAYVFLTESSLPEILSLSPVSALQNSGALTLTVNGANFVSGAQVNWNGSARPTSYISPTRLTASIPASDLATAGPAIVVVVNPGTGGGVSNEATFLVNVPNPLPVLGSLSPATTPAGGSAFTLTVNGNGFVSGTIIRWNGENRTTSFTSATRVTTQISAGDIAAAGSALVTVVNPTPGGGVSNTLNFTITGANPPAPTLTSINPNSALAGDVGFTITVTGSGFVSSSRVEVNGSQRATTFINSTTLTAEILSSDLANVGTLLVTVRTPSPGGGVSGSQPLTVTSLPPTLDSISPVRAIAGTAGLSLSVFGKIFFNGAVIRINGQPRPTTFVNNYQLTTLLTASDLESPRTLAVTVVNPGGATSMTIPLPVYPRVTSVSAASYATGDQARDSILAAFSTNLASGVEVNNTLPLPTTLRGTRVVVTDSAGVSRDQALFFVSPQQINFHLHAETATGAATVTVYNSDAIIALGELSVNTLAPAIFTQNATGEGVPAAYGIRVSGGGSSVVNILTFDIGQSRWVPLAINPGTASEPVYLALFGTGFRAASEAGTVSVRIGTTPIPVQYVGLSPGFIGLDQLNIGPLPLTLAGTGLQQLTITINGRIANFSKVMQLAFGAPPTAVAAR